MMLFRCTLVLSGAIVYASNDQAGAALIAVGCALALVSWLDRVMFRRRTEARAQRGG
jgi:hypothetical protein